MKNKLKYYAPIGISFNTIFWFLVLEYTIIIFSSLNYFSHLENALYEQQLSSSKAGVIIEMESFVSILGLSFNAVPLTFIGCIIGLGIYNWGHHYKHSNSVYLMKRLPNKYEYFRRVMTIPIVSGLLLLVIVFVLLVIYYNAYITKSPEGSVASGQLQLLFDVWFKLT